MKAFIVSVIVVLSVAIIPVYAQVTQEMVAYGGWDNCVRLSNGQVELIATTDVGPRIIRFGFVGGQNLFKEDETQMGQTGGDEWKGYGGHRLWHAPEVAPRTYALDNSPIKYRFDGKTLYLIQPTEPETGIAKEIEVTLRANTNQVTVLHRLTNHNPWDVTLSPWCLTVMAAEGVGIFPHEPYIPHPDKFLPARPLVLWHYTDMADPRWTWGTKYIQLKQDPKATTKQKMGILNMQGWAAYVLKNEVFLKRFPFEEGATYPDFQVNNETFTNDDMLEVETLGPLAPVPANGGSVEHVEEWFLFKQKVGKSDKDIDTNLLPLVEQTKSALK